MTMAGLIHKHRTTLRRQQGRRLEASLTVRLFKSIRNGQSQEGETWKVVESALLAYNKKKPFTGASMPH